MGHERTLVIGLQPADFPVSGFLSDVNLYEFDTVLWFPSSLYAEVAMGQVPSWWRISQFAARVEELHNWVLAGHSLIVIITPLQDMPFIAQDDQEAAFVISTAAPFAGIVFERASGQRIQYCGPGTTSELLKAWMKHLRYHVILNDAELKPLMQVSRSRPGSMQVVAGYKEVGKGKIIFVPPLDPTQANVKQLGNYCTALERLPGCLTTSEPELPEWTEGFQSDAEVVAHADIGSLKAKIYELETKVAEKEHVLIEARSLKQLIAGTGDVFKDAAAHALQELGLAVIDGPHPRTDLIASDGKRLAAIEAKGLEGPAKESNLRQLAVWIAELESTMAASTEEQIGYPDLQRYSEKLAAIGISVGDETIGRDCKGLLIVGTFRKTPLDLRRELDFGHALLPLIKRANVCALTGLQLLGLVLEARKNPNIKSSIVEDLFSTAGVLARATDWTQFLKGPTSSHS